MAAPVPPLGQLIFERMRALGIPSRSALHRRSGDFGGGVPLAQTTLKRWEESFDIQPEHDQLVKLAHTLADTNREEDRRAMIERVFAAAGQTAPETDTLRISPNVMRRLGPRQRRFLERMAEELAGMRAEDIREGRELALAGQPASEDVSDGEGAARGQS